MLYSWHIIHLSFSWKRKKKRNSKFGQPSKITHNRTLCFLCICWWWAHHLEGSPVHTTQASLSRYFFFSVFSSSDLCFFVIWSGLHNKGGARGSVVDWEIMLQAGMSQVRFPMGSLGFSIDLILPVSLWSCGRLSLSQKLVPGILLGVKGGRSVRLTSPLSVSRFSRTCRSLDVLTTLWASTACYRDRFTFFNS
jgi:hypothetical protein